MSRVDSGLGWSCDSAYYFSGTGLFSDLTGYGDDGRALEFKHYKTNEGPAMRFLLVDEGRYTPILVSTNRDYVAMYLQRSNSVTTDTPDYVVEHGYQGTTFYFSYGWYFNNATELTSIPQIESTDLSTILEMMGVVVGGSQQTIPVQFVRQGGVLSDSFDITVRQA